MDSRQVRFSGHEKGPARTWWPEAGDVLKAAGRCAGDPEPVLRQLRAGRMPPPLPGNGETKALWEFLATVASVDLAAARAVEPHFDAAAILAQAGVPWALGTVWGVYAAESGDTRLAASPGDGGTWLLDGDKPWCSLAGQVDRAVVTAHVPDGRRAFATDLRHDGVAVRPGAWGAHGLRGVPSGPVGFDSVPAEPLGDTGWYLRRAGFAWGGIGVAACWFGGSVGLYRTLLAASGRRAPDQLATAWLGEADRLLASGAAVLEQAARAVDGGRAGWPEAHRARGHIAAVSARMLAICGEALGPAPLAFDAEHARRVADLTLYTRQHHGARDDAALGSLVLGGEGPGAW